MRRVGRFSPLLVLILVGCNARSAPGPVTRSAGGQVASTPAGQRDPTPPWERNLTGDDAIRARKLEGQVEQLKRAGRFGDAIAPAGEVSELRARVQGADHWQAADAQREVDDLRTIAALPEEGRKAMATVGDLVDGANVAKQRTEYGESVRLQRMVLEVYRRWLGEDHRRTARAYNNLTSDLHRQGQYAEAEGLHRKVLAIRLKTLGEDHPETATT